MQGIPPIPVAELITSCYQAHVMQHFLLHFRRHEAQVYGSYLNVRTPFLFTCDQGTANLAAALHKFNQETISSLLCRAWEAVNDLGSTNLLEKRLLTFAAAILCDGLTRS